MKLTLITGASSGMGLEYARQLAAAGNDLLIVSNQQEQLLQVTADIAEQYGVNVIPRFQDLAAPDAAGQLFAFCNDRDYEIDTLVLNAGMFFFKELSPGTMPLADKMMSLHMIANTRLCILFGEQMKRRRRGHILLMASMAASLPMPGITVYSATKAYLKSFGRSLYFEMRPYGVSVTTICPAAIGTPLYKLREDLMRLGVKIGVIWTPERLVKRAIKGMNRGRRLMRPGIMNFWLPPLIAALPKFAVTSIWQKIK